MELVHPMKFEERKNLSLQDQRSSIDALKSYYPFVVTDSIALEHNLSVLYNNREIKILLDRRIKERDAIVARKKARQQEAAEIAAGMTTERELTEVRIQKRQIHVLDSQRRLKLVWLKKENQACKIYYT